MVSSLLTDAPSPEMHRIHHQCKHHKNNCGDIPWRDMLFGTDENPREWDDACGFEHDREQRLVGMLPFKDVHKE